MRKFKHEKTGIIGRVKEYHLYFERCKGNVCSQESISMDLIEDSKDWKEISNVDYKIIGFTDGFNTYFEISTGVWAINPSNTFLYEQLLSNTTTKVKKVKRLSDNNVFTIGESVLLQDNTFNRHIITNFHVRNNTLTVELDSVTEVPIGNINRIPCVSFKSFDNLELDENSFYFVVDLKFEFVHKGQPLQYPSFTKNPSKYYIFANKENALNFIIENKPCLSLIDIDVMIEKTSCYRFDQLEYLKKLIKTKIC